MTKRALPAIIVAPTHGGPKPCHVMLTSTVCTIQLPEGHFAAIVSDRDDLELGAITILDREEVEAHILFLRSAIEDAERLDAGLPPIHASPTGTRQ